MTVVMLEGVPVAAVAVFVVVEHCKSHSQGGSGGTAADFSSSH